MRRKGIIFCLIILMILSIINNYYGSNNLFIKELIWYIIGFILIMVINKININFILKYSFYLYLLGNILLLLALIIGKSVNGARGWISLGMFSFQPSEFMKVFLIFYLRYFTLKYNFNDYKYILFSLVIILIHSILTFLEPDTGAVIIYFIIWITYLGINRVNKWYFIVGGLTLLVLIIGFLLLYYKYQSVFIKIFGTSFFYRMDRITNFFNSDGYQIKQALTSISNSGVWGIKRRVYFPEESTDFALTLFIANFGIFGLIVLLMVYSLLFYNLININGDIYLIKPLIWILLFQYSINILMNVGLFPIIGLPLPFISYGGSSLISYMILLGFILKDKHDTYL